MVIHNITSSLSVTARITKNCERDVFKINFGHDTGTTGSCEGKNWNKKKLCPNINIINIDHKRVQHSLSRSKIGTGYDS